MKAKFGRGEVDFRDPLFCSLGILLRNELVTYEWLHLISLTVRHLELLKSDSKIVPPSLSSKLAIFFCSFFSPQYCITYDLIFVSYSWIMFVFFYLLKIDARFILYYFYFYFYLISTLLFFLQYICNSNKVLAQKLWSQYKSSLIYKDGLHVFFSIIYQIKKHSLSIIMCVYICLHHCRGYF